MKIKAVWLLALLVVMGLAATTRLINLSSTELSGDECFSWRLANYPVGELISRTAADVHPPAYYLLLKAWITVWGSSPWALRALSTAFSVLCVPILYALSLQTWRFSQPNENGSTVWERGGALFGAFLLAVHLSQVTPGRTARMYSLGILLAAVTGWLLLRAFRAKTHKAFWWCAYGITVAVFCYTHNYAFFTIVAQVIFVAIILSWRLRTQPIRPVIQTAAWFFLAQFIALLIYSPWLPAVWSQIHQVRQNYWISPLTFAECERVFFSWAMGMEYPGSWESLLCIAILALLTIWTLWYAPVGASFFLLQACVPWILSLAISAYSGQSIFVERYLAFSQVFLLGLWSFTWCLLPGIVERIVLSCFLGISALVGLWPVVNELGDKPPAIASAAEFLHSFYEGGDLILVDAPRDVNRLRYYATQAGLQHIKVCCTIDSSSKGAHVPHLASLSPDDLLSIEPDSLSATTTRLWQACDHEGGLYPPNGMKTVLKKSFEGGNDTRYNLVLYERGK
jgi:hypothetical protein